MQKMLRRSFYPIIAIMAALAVSALLILAAGRDPVVIFGKMIQMTFGSDYGTGQIMFRMTSLIFTGLAVAIPFRVKLFNIGGEGQLLGGAFAAAVAGALLPEQTPAMAAVIIACLAAMMTGGSLGFLSGWLKIRHDVNEVISTIMLNFLAAAAVSYLLTSHMAVPSTAHTPDIIAQARIAGIDDIADIWRKAPANFSMLLAAAACASSYLLLYKTRFGYEMRATGLQSEAARYAGIDTSFHRLAAMTAGGAVAGLGAANLVLGYKHSFEAGLTSGLGFTGIAVALLAYAHPLWIVPSALLFGFLEYGGLAVNAYVPKDIFMIVQAVIIIVVMITARKS
ncbi:MAG TPA: ABC transporter permease [Prosthecochloris aestuarii]|uniref:ABC transporter permease n=1 Tax=Prosthecochloris aestuarii TaxID=1102 RepID=A0A831SMV4_PROAE|nr:ABC transporter permease [Prosthecochloris sp.]HED31377.1 ABC transporter permease [Prosthecochloris aestuarii]